MGGDVNPQFPPLSISESESEVVGDGWFREGQTEGRQLEGGGGRGRWEGSGGRRDRMHDRKPREKEDKWVLELDVLSKDFFALASTLWFVSVLKFFEFVVMHWAWTQCVGLFRFQVAWFGCFFSTKLVVGYWLFVSSCWIREFSDGFILQQIWKPIHLGLVTSKKKKKNQLQNAFMWTKTILNIYFIHLCCVCCIFFLVQCLYVGIGFGTLWWNDAWALNSKSLAQSQSLPQGLIAKPPLLYESLVSEGC